MDDLPTMQKDRISLIHGSLTYRDKRLAGYDAATVVEVIEHQDPPRLAAFERVLFEFARPQTVVTTTPKMLSITSNSRHSLPAACGTGIIDLSGRALNFKRGQPPFALVSGTRPVFCQLGRKTRLLEAQRKWRFSPEHEIAYSRTRCGRANRAVWLRKIHVRPKTIPNDRNPFVGFLSRAGFGRCEQSGGYE